MTAVIILLLFCATNFTRDLGKMEWTGGLHAKENENYLFVWEKAGGKKKYRRM
jgi:hypothetical protein